MAMVTDVLEVISTLNIMLSQSMEPKNWEYFLSHTAANQFRCPYLFISAVLSPSVLCVYHASLLTRNYSDGWGSGKN